MRPQRRPKGGFPEGRRSEKHRSNNRMSQMRPQRRPKGGFPEGMRSEKKRSPADRAGNQTHLPHRRHGHFAARHRRKEDHELGIKLPHQEALGMKLSQLRPGILVIFGLCLDISFWTVGGLVFVGRERLMLLERKAPPRRGRRKKELEETTRLELLEWKAPPRRGGHKKELGKTTRWSSGNGTTQEKDKTGAF